MKKCLALLLVTTGLLGGCAGTPPTKIGSDTYYSAQTNTAGIFGDVSAVTGGLMVDGNQFCSNMGKEFELVTQSSNPNIPFVRLGGASITFKCVDKAGGVVMRPDKGVTTIQSR